MSLAPTPPEVMERARKIAAQIRHQFEKPHLTKEEWDSENEVLCSLAIIYWNKSSENYAHTISAGLIEVPEAMPYMDYAKEVLERVNAGQLNCLGSVWCHSVSQWRLSWGTPEN